MPSNPPTHPATHAVVFRPQQPPEQLQDAVRAAEQAGVAELWLWEDCFLDGGLTASTAALAWSDTLRVGIGLLPVPFRNPAAAAMELATLARLFPNRFVAGLGHGVLDWMAQVGARAESPMTLLREHTDAVRRLLHGETVDVEGRYVRLDRVALDRPPAEPPRVLVGARGPRTVRLAGEVGDGVILAHPAPVDDVRAACRLLAEGWADAGRYGHPDVVVYAELDPQLPDLVGRMASRSAELATAGATTVAFQGPDAAPQVAPFVEALARL